MKLPAPDHDLGLRSQARPRRKSPATSWVGPASSGIYHQRGCRPDPSPRNGCGPPRPHPVTGSEDSANLAARVWPLPTVQAAPGWPKCRGACRVARNESLPPWSGLSSLPGIARRRNCRLGARWPSPQGGTAWLHPSRHYRGCARLCLCRGCITRTGKRSARRTRRAATSSGNKPATRVTGSRGRACRTRLGR